MQEQVAIQTTNIRNNYFHFLKYFTPFVQTQSNLIKLCAILGLHIFTIDPNNSFIISYPYFINQAIKYQLPLNFNNSFKLYLCTMILQIGLNWNPSIVESIAQIRFPKLQVLSLNGNNLLSIEPLSNIDLQYLKLLQLDSNNIMSIDCLGKTNWSLETLTMSHNQIGEYGRFVRGNWEKLECLDMNHNKMSHYVEQVIRMHSPQLIKATHCNNIRPMKFWLN